MNNTMISENGVGLAAPQVNVPKRIILVRPSNKTYVLINPEIKFKSEEKFSDYIFNIDYWLCFLTESKGGKDY